MVVARLTLDPVGNTTTAPRPGAPNIGVTLTYDAWNRLVEVKSGAMTLAKHRYDGLGRRIDQAVFPPVGFQRNHTYYNASWQILEIRRTTGSTPPESLQPKYQYVWSARYIGAPVLRGQAPSRQWLILCPRVLRPTQESQDHGPGLPGRQPGRFGGRFVLPGRREAGKPHAR